MISRIVCHVGLLTDFRWRRGAWTLTYFLTREELSQLLSPSPFPHPTRLCLTGAIRPPRQLSLLSLQQPAHHLAVFVSPMRDKPAVSQWVFFREAQTMAKYSAGLFPRTEHWNLHYCTI